MIPVCRIWCLGFRFWVFLLWFRALVLRLWIFILSVYGPELMAYFHMWWDTNTWAERFPKYATSVGCLNLLSINKTPGKVCTPDMKSVWNTTLSHVHFTLSPSKRECIKWHSNFYARLVHENPGLLTSQTFTDSC